MYYLGVDIGNTKSLAVVTDAQGSGLALGKGGCGNHESLGAEGYAAVLRDIVNQAVAQAGIDRADIVGAGFGIAGFDWENDRPMIDAGIASLGLNCPYHAVNDAMLGLVAGASEGWGVVVSSGTSGNARGRDQHGREAVMTGNGNFFGEVGGGYELVCYAIAAISRAWSKRAPETLITDLFVQHIGAKDATDLLEGWARGRYPVKATYAPLVFEAFQRGDKTAEDGLRWVAAGLADLGTGIIRQLELQDSDFELVLSASFFNGSPHIAEWMGARVHEIAPRARLVRLDAPPVAGGVLLGMEQIGTPALEVRAAVRAACTALLGDFQYA